MGFVLENMVLRGCNSTIAPQIFIRLSLRIYSYNGTNCRQSMHLKQVVLFFRSSEIINLLDFL